MLSHMRTSIDIKDALLREAQRHALEHDLTLEAVVEEGLRRVVEEPAPPKRARYKYKGVTVKGEGLQDGIREGDWETIRSIIYEGRGG